MNKIHVKFLKFGVYAVRLDTDARHFVNMIFQKHCHCVSVLSKTRKQNFCIFLSWQTSVLIFSLECFLGSVMSSGRQKPLAVFPCWLGWLRQITTSPQKTTDILVPTDKTIGFRVLRLLLFLTILTVAVSFTSRNLLSARRLSSSVGIHFTQEAILSSFPSWQTYLLTHNAVQVQIQVLSFSHFDYSCSNEQPQGGTKRDKTCDVNKWHTRESKRKYSPNRTEITSLIPEKQ